MKAFKRSSFFPHNCQPLTLLLLIQALFSATACALQQLNFFFFFKFYYHSPACSVLSSSSYSNSPTHSSQGCHQKPDSWTAACLTAKKTPQKTRRPDLGGGVNLGLLWIHAFCREIQHNPLSNLKLPPSVCSFMPPPTYQIFPLDMIFLNLLYQPSAVMKTESWSMRGL